MFYQGEVIQGVFSPNAQRTRAQFDNLISAAQQFDSALPEKDIPIVANYVFFLGMPERKNFQGKHHATQMVPIDDQWFAELPEALILMLGVHEAWPEIQTYIQDYEMIPASCVPLVDWSKFRGLGDHIPTAVVLFVWPEHHNPEIESNCTPELLGIYAT